MRKEKIYIYPPKKEDKKDRPYYYKFWKEKPQLTLDKVNKFIEYINLLNQNNTNEHIKCILYLYACTLEEAVEQAKRANKNYIDGRLYRIDFTQEEIEELINNILMDKNN